VKRRFLPKLASRSIGAYALSEAGSGSDAFALASRAEDRGDHFVLDGRKLWITNANEADVFLVFANINPEAGYRGITAFLVERGFEGFTVGKKEDKLGIRASSTCELLFDSCKVPRENVLGAVGKGYKVAIETLNEGRIGIGAQMIGLAKGALEHAVTYTKERTQFGKAIADFQGVQFQLARAAVDLEVAKLSVYNAARLRDAGKPFLTEAAICKIFSSEVAERRQPIRRLRLRQGLPRRETLSRRQDRTDLRRHVQPAARDHRQAAARLTGSQGLPAGLAKGDVAGESSSPSSADGGPPATAWGGI
jgi:alkylation response protein AidB-like acyl-CoA dehydrogenase